jgi:hypothetical protein
MRAERAPSIGSSSRLHRAQYRSGSADDGPPRLVIDTDDFENIACPLVVNADRRHGPALHYVAGTQSLLGAFHLAACEALADLEDTPLQFQDAWGLRSAM